MKQHRQSTEQAQTEPEVQQAPASAPSQQPASSGRNPLETPDSDGDTRSHEEVSIYDGQGMGWANESEEQAVDSQIHILHRARDPLELAGTPSPGQLYETQPMGDSCEPGWDPVRTQYSSVDAPNRTEELLPNTLFIDGGPSTSDIIQGGIGDCYYLAALTTIVSSDPSKIQSMITPAGASVKFTFFRYDAAANGGLGGYVPATITVDNELARTTGSDGTDYGLLGSSFRVAENPTNSAWWAGIRRSEEAFWVSEKAEFEAALWAPLMEKAFARFSEIYGQYGGHPGRASNASTDDAGNAVSGYDVLHGGIAQLIHGIFYGDDVVDVGWFGTSHDPEQSASENSELLKSLLQVNGEGVPEGEAYNLTVSTSPDQAVDRLKTQVEHTLGQPYLQNYGEAFTNMLTRLSNRLNRWEGESDPAKKESQRSAIGDTATHIVTPGNWPVLNSDREGGDFRELQDLLLVVNNLGTDGTGSSDTQRMVYAWHEYSVLGAILRDKQGAVLTPSLSDIDAGKVAVDPMKSTVSVRNPHGTNEMDRMGDGPQGEDDGAFDLTLDEYARVFAEFEWAQVKTTP